MIQETSRMCTCMQHTENHMFCEF